MTADESHRLIASGTDVLIFTPPLSPRPTLRLKGDGAPARGVFLSSPRAMPEGTSNATPIKAHSEPAVAVWFGEKKGAPGGVRLFPLSQLVGSVKTEAGGQNGDGPATENKEFPQTAARKAFYKADKLNVKWNNAGTMVRSSQLRVAVAARADPTGTVPHT
jgi:translation initiation factor 2A